MMTEGESSKVTVTEIFMGLLMALFIAGALILFVAGFMTENAITQTALFAGAAVLAIFARIAQAARHHAELMERLSRMR